MKKAFCISIFISIYIFLLLSLLLERYTSHRPVPTEQESLRKVTSVVYRLASDDNFSFNYNLSEKERPRQIYISPYKYPELTDIVLRFAKSFSTNGLYYEYVDLNNEGVINIKWENAIVYIDLNTLTPEKSIYIEYNGYYYMAETDKEDIKSIVDLIKKVKTNDSK